MTDDEINLSDILEHQFPKAGAVADGISKWDFIIKVMRLRIKKPKRLGVCKKNIEVAAFAMIDLEHHCRAAAQRPGIDDRLFGVHLIDKRTSRSK